MKTFAQIMDDAIDYYIAVTEGVIPNTDDERYRLGRVLYLAANYNG